jgi:hypothetical protein
MRALLAALLLAAPALASAYTLRLDAPAVAAPRLELGLPQLTLGEGGQAPLDLELARDRGGRVEPALCLVLGIIPGFGVGHLLAHSRNWVIWLVVDIVVAVVFWGPYWYWPGHPGYFPVLNLLVLVERIFEGVSAYQAAGGGRLLPFDGSWAQAPPSPAALALPVGYRPGGRG